LITVAVMTITATVRVFRSTVDWICDNPIGVGLRMVLMIAVASLALGVVTGVIVGAFSLGVEIGSLASIAIMIGFVVLSLRTT
jgi:hypothetical protein